MAANTLYYFAAGGTGALSVEPLLHLCAAGVGPDRLAVILIDADVGSPALGRAQELIGLYDEVRRAFGRPAQGFFRTELIRTSRAESVWSPLGVGDAARLGSVALQDFVQQPRMAGPTEDARVLFDLLFSREQQIEQLREGFRGNPAIGSILMHGLKETPFFKELMNSAKNDTSARFFATGSVFGGTGASGLPVLANVLRGIGIDSARIGAALVTPYYSLGEPSREEQQSNRLKPDSAKFMRATAAALPTYTRGHTDYGALYVIGDDQSLPKPRKTFSSGGPEQLNDPHFVELYAAMAALDFVERGAQHGGAPRYVTAGDAEPTWSDLPVGRVAQEELATFLVASNFFLHYFGSTRSPADEQRLTGELQKLPWIDDADLKPDFVRTHSEQLNLLGRYFDAVWGYLWATGENYRALRLADFSSRGRCEVPVPHTYASSKSQPRVPLPMVEKCLWGRAARRQKSWFRKGAADALTSPAEMFNWYNEVNKLDVQGMPGLLRYLREGSKRFIGDWFSAATEARGVTV